MGALSRNRTAGQSGSFIERIGARIRDAENQRAYNEGRAIRYDAGRPRFKPTFTDAGLDRANLRGAIDDLLSDQRQLDGSPAIQPAKGKKAGGGRLPTRRARFGQ